MNVVAPVAQQAGTPRASYPEQLPEQLSRAKNQIRAALKSVLIRLSPPARDAGDALYVGLGNEFDDDRRLVRASASAPRPDPPPTGASIFPSFPDHIFGRTSHAWPRP